jgi:hypothetical protein
MSGFVGYVKTAEYSESKDRHSAKNQAYFLICESCFWCATALSLRRIKNETIPKCPMCDDVYCIVPISGGHEL